MLALEAHGDSIAALDGAANPSLEGWTTEFGAPSHLISESGESTVPIKERHNANRYSEMAKGAADGDSGVRWFLNGGTMTAKDYHVTRG